jgi:Uri superfamily endonuclease
MAASNRPWWRSAVDRADRMVTPTANSFVRTDIFADAVSAATRLEARLRRRVERQATWVWHVYHLPSSGDVRRISAQLAALEARVRDMQERLEDLDSSDVGQGKDEARST